MTDLTDASGAVVKSYAYDAYGTILESTGTLDQPYTYTGREFDAETGLYYYRARYYDATTGRFLERDPSDINGGINVYRYVDNDPVNHIDPNGFFTLPLVTPPVSGTMPKQEPRSSLMIPLPPIPYGNYGGAGWTGGRSGIAPSVDSMDDCFEAHDKCYGGEIDGDCPVGREVCDQELAKCLSSLSPNPADWPRPSPYADWFARIYRSAAIRYFSR